MEDMSTTGISEICNHFVSCQFWVTEKSYAIMCSEDSKYIVSYEKPEQAWAKKLESCF